MSRKTKLTPELQELIVRDVSNGVLFHDAAQAAGIDEGTFFNWMRWGAEKKSGIYFKFFMSIRRAEAEARKKHTLVISRAGAEGDWRASLEYLKRHDRTHWGDNLDVTSGGKPLKGYVSVSPDDWDKENDSDV